jgi:CubicO group peptidase (beta-lactamase class C family)
VRLQAPARVFLQLASLFLATQLAAAPTSLARSPVPLPSDEDLSAFAAFVEERMAEEPSAGLSVAFWLDGQVWARGFGHRDLERKLPATADTSYRMASVTKPMTAMAVLQLAEAGKLDLDADVRRYVPYFPKKRWVVTPRHLLGHLGGISHYKHCPRECHLTTHHNTRQAIDIFAAWPLESEPGATYKYTSYGYNLLGAAVEGASGTQYAAYLRRFIFGRAGMSRSGIETKDAVFHERAKGYRTDGKRVMPAEIIDISSRFAGGGSRSTVTDMVAFAGAYMNGELVSEQTMRELEASMWTRDGVLTDYGMGFGVLPQSGRWVLAHGGGQQETSTLLVLYPAERFAVALAANLEDYHLALHDVKERLVAVALGDGGARRTPVGDDEHSAVVARALSGLMSHGVAHYKRWGEGATTSPGELIDAFASLAELLRAEQIAKDPTAALERARLADDPIGGRVYPRAGAHMAGVIARHLGPAALRRYHDDAPFAFVLDYARACEALRCPPPFRLDPALVKLARQHEPRWVQANDPALRALRITPATEPEALAALLARHFTGAPIHPDLSLEIKRAAEAAQKQGDEPRARSLLEVGLAYHPQSARLLRAVAQTRVDEGRLQDAQALLVRWDRVDEEPREARRAALLEEAKRRRKQSGVAAELAWLEAARPLYSDDTVLLDRLADAADAVGRKHLVKEALRAAEESSPSPQRRRRLEQLLRAGQ